MFIQTVMPQDIVELCLATCVVSKAYNTTSHRLYYRKLDESIAKQYFRITDVYSKVESTDNYYNLYIKISASDDKNWNYFEQYLLVRIEKNN